MYAKLGEILRKRYGRKRRFRVVEDGGTKGFQSGKGVAAKQEQKIQSWKLPPRTPSWMPHRLLPLAANREAGLVEPGRQAFGRQDYAAHLRAVATHVPKGAVQSCLERMHSSIQEVVAPKGCHATLD